MPAKLSIEDIITKEQKTRTALAIFMDFYNVLSRLVHTSIISEINPFYILELRFIAEALGVDLEKYNLKKRFIIPITEAVVDELDLKEGDKVYIVKEGKGAKAVNFRTLPRADDEVLKDPAIFYQLKAEAVKKLLDEIKKLEVLEPSEIEFLQRRIAGVTTRTGAFVPVAPLSTSVSETKK